MLDASFERVVARRIERQREVDISESLIRPARSDRSRARERLIHGVGGHKIVSLRAHVVGFEQITFQLLLKAEAPVKDVCLFEIGRETAQTGCGEIDVPAKRVGRKPGTQKQDWID